MMEKRNVHKVLPGMADWKWSIGRPRYRWMIKLLLILKKQDGRVGCDSSSVAQADKWQALVAIILIECYRMWDIA